MSENYFIDSSYEYVKPEDFISDDTGNNIILGTDKKLMVRTIQGSDNGSAKSISITLDNVKSGDEIVIPKVFDKDYSSSGVISMWEYKQGTTETTSLLNYNEPDKFIENELIEFTDTGARLKSDYIVEMNFEKPLEEYKIHSATIDLDTFKSFGVI